LWHVHLMFVSPWLFSSLIPYHLKRVFVWRFNVTNNNKTYSYLHVKCPYFCPVLTKFGIFFADFSLKSPVSNLMEICRVGAVLIYTDRQTDVTKVMGPFRDNWTLLKRGFSLPVWHDLMWSHCNCCVLVCDMFRLPHFRKLWF
jgi:hypothetical protein